MDERMTFKYKNEDGIEVEYEVLFTFDSEETHKSYMVYTDNSKDSNGNIKVYASVYEAGASETQLSPIETDKEWKIIETILSELQEQGKGDSNE